MRTSTLPRRMWASMPENEEARIWLRLRADRDRRRNADEDQERRQQEAAADAEHAREEPDHAAEPEQQEQVRPTSRRSAGRCPSMTRAGRLDGRNIGQGPEPVKARPLRPPSLGRRGVVRSTERTGKSAPNPASCAHPFYAPPATLEGTCSERSSARRHLADRLGRGQDHDLLHVRLPLRHQSAPEGRPDPLHRGQPRPPGQPRRAVRQGLGRDHAALLAGAPDQAAEAGRRARRRRVPGDRVGRGARHRDRVARPDPRRAIRASSPSSPGATRARR